MCNSRNTRQSVLVLKRSWLTVLAAVVLLAMTAHPPAFAMDDEKNPHLWQPRVRSVAVFKNGLGFFMREGEVQLRKGWCVAEHIPPAAFGTLAVYAHDEKETVDIVGSGPGELIEFDDRDAPKNIAAKRARLEASINLKVQLTYTHNGQDRTAAGKLVSVGPKFAVLDGDSNSLAVPVDGVTKMQILELPLRIHLVSESAKQPRKTTLGMAYLRKGITWIPEYTLKILDDETAELMLRGTLVNEAEDLIHTDVHLVVGVPHFTHTDYMAPIAVGQMIRMIGSAVAPQAVATQIMNRAAIVSNIRTATQFGLGRPVTTRPVAVQGDDLSSAIGNLPQMGGRGAATDYTVYTKKDLTLRRGEKAIITLFNRKITYSHTYRWATQRRMEHFLVLHNSTDTAWTTGPCLAVSGKRPFGKDLLKYTPKGGNGEFPVTAAINIVHDKSEREIYRKFYSPIKNVRFDLVTLAGKLKLRNYEKRTVDIVVTNPVPGKPVEADANGDISSDSTKLKRLERSGSVTWRVKMKPGEEKTLTYVYERYVPL